jgi:hypothetical protein
MTVPGCGGADGGQVGRGRGALAVLGVGVLGLAFLHALFYVGFMPPWSIVNEPQHLDYVLKLRDQGRIPDIREPILPAIAEAVWRSERWRTSAAPRPKTREEALGRGGRSYEGYQPPFYYALMVPVATLAGGDPVRAMYAVRVASTALLVIMAAITWALAVRWCPSGGPWVGAGAALLVSAIPVVASSCARATNDGLVAVLVAGGVLAVARLVDRPSLGRAGLAGLLGASALLTKSPGTLLTLVIVVGLAAVGRRGLLRASSVVAALGPVATAWVTWAVFIYGRYGVPDGTWAFLTIYGRPEGPLFAPLAFVREGWLSTWVAPPIFLYAGSLWQRVVTSTVLTAIAVVGAVGSLRRERPGLALASVAVLSAGSLAIVWVGNVQSIVPPVGRVLMVTYPAGAALIVGGWVRLLGPRAALVPAGLAWMVAVAYEALQLVPLVRPWWFRP